MKALFFMFIMVAGSSYAQMVEDTTDSKYSLCDIKGNQDGVQRVQRQAPKTATEVGSVGSAAPSVQVRKVPVRGLSSDNSND